MKLAGRTLAPALLVSMFVALGCGDTTGPPSNPSPLTGEWSFFWVAVDSTPCSFPELQQGCSGGGTLDLVQFGPQVTGNWTARGGLQTCGGAADFAASGQLRPASSWSRLEFELPWGRFRADLPPGRVDVLTGTVSCDLAPGQVAQGTWQMTRSSP